MGSLIFAVIFGAAVAAALHLFNLWRLSLASILLIFAISSIRAAAFANLFDGLLWWWGFNFLYFGSFMLIGVWILARFPHAYLGAHESERRRIRW
jgi:hypothetical protein